MRQVDEFSAGGLVVDLAGAVPRGALIGRTDRHGRLLWSLPKGHIEAGETAEQAAVREVEEETGICRRHPRRARHDRLLVRRGGPADPQDGAALPAARAPGASCPTPTSRSTEVAWVPLPDIPAQLAYPDERGLIDAAGRLLADTA